MERQGDDIPDAGAIFGSNFSEFEESRQQRAKNMYETD